MNRRRRTRRRRRYRINWKRFAPAMLLLAVLLYSAGSLIRYAIRSAGTRRQNAQLEELYENAKEQSDPQERKELLVASLAADFSEDEEQHTLLSSYQFIGHEVLPEIEELIAQNPDTVGWLRIPGVVSLPVVYRDNVTYLDHDFRGRSSNSGTLFLDQAHPFESDTQYLVIHGHNMYDGSMFGLLSHYRKQGYMEEHPTVYFSTPYRIEEYEVIGVLRVSPDPESADYARYIGTRSFETIGLFEEFAQDIRSHALYWKENAEMYPEDAYLALSTCYDDDRIVVMCRRTNPD